MTTPQNDTVVIIAINSHTGMYGVFGCGRMIGQPAVDDTTQLRHQGRRGSPLCARRGTDISIAIQKAFFFDTFFCRPTKESMDSY